jgi:hypothetical protein
MQHKRFNVEQILRVLKKADGQTSVSWLKESLVVWLASKLQARLLNQRITRFWCDRASTRVSQPRPLAASR